MDKITCKHCGTKYPADVSKCPLCGASNAPAVGDEFDFLDDDFEATPAPQPAAPVEAPETPADTAAAAEKPAEETGSAEQVTFDGGAPSSGNTSRYNWEEILAEINRQKEEGGAAKQPEPEEAPQPAAPAAPQAPAAETVPEDDEDDEQEAPRATLRRERKKKRGGKGLLIGLLVVAVLAVGVLALKKTGALDKLLKKSEPAAEETPELPVEQDVACTGLTLSVNELSVTGIGSTATLQAKLEPENCTDKVHWFSGDTAIATIDADGKVTAVAEGSTNIQATCGDYAATCRVTVTAEAEGNTEEANEPEQAASGDLALSATDITMTYPGEMARLYVENAGDQAVTWSTDNSTLLSISEDGLITALGTGTANVYAEVGGEKLECIVRLRLGGVEGQAITVSLNTTDISMFYEGETFQLKVSGASADSGFTWTSSDESVCTVDESGIIKAVGNGTAYVSTTADGVNLKCIVRVNFDS